MTTDQTVAYTTQIAVSADGQSKTISADYNGNGSFEHIETWQVLADGSQVDQISDANLLGNLATVAKGTETISADGLTTTRVKTSLI